MIYFQEAWAVLAANKLRSLLTITGLIIGVAAVIAIQVLGGSMAGAIDGLLGGMSDNSFIIFPNTQQNNAFAAAIKLSDLPEIKRAVPQVVETVPVAFVNDLVRNGHHAGRYRISPESAIPFDNLPAIYGRHIDQHDIDSAANVCVLKHDAYVRLFPEGGDPTGQSVYAGPNRFVIVGVLDAPKQGLINAGFAGQVAIPWTSYVERYLRGNTLFAARFVVADPSTIAAAENAVIAQLRELRGKPDLQYQTFDKSQVTQGIDGVFTAMTMVVAFIGAVSLLVAGIGIMNIMLVSVAERTREIGVRKAIGAKRSQVLAQFFIEALLLCGTGCAIGWAIGVGLGALVNGVAIVKVTGTIVGVPWLQTIAIAGTFAIVVTLAFGTYPAYRAARLDPIEALRYE
ncbi:MAG: ABC transporter permease [Candidatus Eremiobacteraeota bacterium]|nr:ABC transporter permease [Candidatus Eremiobacteraeota bacterium]MBV8433237.1 ABC transporter permease [Candidatus Eremiobacteraeota bacterium]